jgi:hypothetical protein
MRVGKRTRLGVTLMLVAGAATLILGCKGTRKQASVAEAPPDGATQQATLKAPPIPEAGPLALPSGRGFAQNSAMCYSSSTLC